jgi:hypothetical protein
VLSTGDDRTGYTGIVEAAPWQGRESCHGAAYLLIHPALERDPASHLRLEPPEPPVADGSEDERESGERPSVVAMTDTVAAYRPFSPVG